MVGNTLQDRLDWMINVISGYARESLELLGWQPTTAQILACNCAKGVDPVDYGNRLGYSCPVRNANDIQPEGGPNLLCHNESGQNILHFCPEGFVPSCDEGCSLPGRDGKTNFKSSSRRIRQLPMGSDASFAQFF